jgi:UDP-N-acetylglucosamine:LPS N-acetylglucosamine transferase
MKICIACSAGGHLVEVMQLYPLIKNYPHFFITFKREQSKELLKNKKAYFVIDPKRNLFKLLLNFFQVFRILIKEKPKVIISTGAASAIPACFIGKLLGSKVIFIESLAAVDRPSLSGRFAYLVADLFIVQWENLLKFYKKAIYGGKII